jgi:hypothetical protein
VNRYPLQPLLAALGCDERSVKARLGLDHRQVARYATDGLTEARAEQLAAMAGLLAIEVWPEMIDDAIAELPACDRCGERYVPVRKAQRWCSARCRNYNAQAAHQRRRWAADPEWAEAQRERVRRYRAETAAYQRAQAKVRYQRRRAREAEAA